MLCRAHIPAIKKTLCSCIIHVEIVLYWNRASTHCWNVYCLSLPCHFRGSAPKYQQRCSQINVEQYGCCILIGARHCLKCLQSYSCVTLYFEFLSIFGQGDVFSWFLYCVYLKVPILYAVSAITIIALGKGENVTAGDQTPNHLLTRVAS